MPDIQLPSNKKGATMNAPNVPVNTNPLGLDLGAFRLSDEECKRAKSASKLVYGLEFYLFEQCSDNLNSPVFHLSCEGQTQDGITIDLKADVGEVATNCPNSKRSFLKHESVTIEVSLSAVALADSGIMSFLEGRRLGENGNMRSYGHGAVKNYMAVLVDPESETAEIYPNVQYIPSSIQIKRAWNSEPSSKIMFTASKANIGDGKAFFSEVRSLTTSTDLPASY